MTELLCLISRNIPWSSFIYTESLLVLTLVHTSWVCECKCEANFDVTWLFFQRTFCRSWAHFNCWELFDANFVTSRIRRKYEPSFRLLPSAQNLQTNALLFFLQSWWHSSVLAVNVLQKLSIAQLFSANLWRQLHLALTYAGLTYAATRNGAFTQQIRVTFSICG